MTNQNWLGSYDDKMVEDMIDNSYKMKMAEVINEVVSDYAHLFHTNLRFDSDVTGWSVSVIEDSVRKFLNDYLTMENYRVW